MVNQEMSSTICRCLMLRLYNVLVMTGAEYLTSCANIVPNGTEILECRILERHPLQHFVQLFQNQFEFF